MMDTCADPAGRTVNSRDGRHQKPSTEGQERDSVVRGQRTKLWKRWLVFRQGNERHLIIAVCFSGGHPCLCCEESVEEEALEYRPLGTICHVARVACSWVLVIKTECAT